MVVAISPLERTRNRGTAREAGIATL